MINEQLKINNLDRELGLSQVTLKVPFEVWDKVVKWIDDLAAPTCYLTPDHHKRKLRVVLELDNTLPLEAHEVTIAKEIKGDFKKEADFKITVATDSIKVLDAEFQTK